MLKNIISILVLGIVSSCLLSSQTIVWEKSFGTTHYGSAVRTVADGYVVAGGSITYPNYTAYVVKTDFQGTKLWTKSYGDAAHPLIIAALETASDNAFVLGGSDNSQPMLMCIDSVGNKLWSLLVAGAAAYGSVHAVVRISDGFMVTGYVYAGNTNTLFYSKVSTSGALLWTKTVSGYKSSMAFAIAQTPNGFVISGTADASAGAESYLLKIDPDGLKQWERMYSGIHSSADPDQANGVALTSDGGFAISARTALSSSSGNTVIEIIKTASDGSLQWRKQVQPSIGDGGRAIIAQNDRLLVVGSSHLLATELNGTLLWDCSLNTEYLNGLAIAPNNAVVVVGSTNSQGLSLGLVSTPTIRYFVCKDGLDQPIARKELTLYKATMSPANDQRIIAQTTDSLGRIVIDPSWFNDGDAIRAVIAVQTVSTNKPLHSNDLIKNVIYRITLDNLQFDERTSLPKTTVKFDNYIASQSTREQVLHLNHTMIIYDLMVSVEFDADDAYMENIKQGFAITSNYLFDVFDGQVALGNVAVYDDKVNWLGADICIRASTDVWPNAGIKAYLSDQVGQQQQVFMPRRWFGSVQSTRDNCVLSTWQGAFQENVWRTVAHELGHQLMGFYDEYVNGSGSSLDSLNLYTLGFMDYHYNDASGTTLLDKIYTSELSTADRYRLSDKQSRQWFMNGSDCWTQFQNNFSGMHNGVYCPIYKPQDRSTLAAGAAYMLGPNDGQTTNPAYDISSLLHCTIVNKRDAVLNQPLLAFSSNKVALNGANCILTKKRNSVVLDEGYTSASGQLRILGAEKDDQYIISGSVGTGVNKTAVSMNGTISRTDNPKDNIIQSGDSVIEVHAVEGAYRFVPLLSKPGSGLDLSLRIESQFQSIPAATLVFENGSVVKKDYSFESSKQNYLLHCDSLPMQTIILSDAKDQTSSSFVFRMNSTSSPITNDFFADNGACWLTFDAKNRDSLAHIYAVSSTFPPLRNGLDSSALQAGSCHALLFPDNHKTLQGSNSLTIHYAHGDVPLSAEQSLRIFRWDASINSWKYLGGKVDTMQASVSVPIILDGTYAAFTTSESTGVEQDEEFGATGLALSMQAHDARFVFNLRLAGQEQTQVCIHNALGQRVATLLSASLDGGTHTLEWNATQAPSGVYFCRVTTASQTKTMQFSVLR